MEPTTAPSRPTAGPHAPPRPPAPGAGPAAAEAVLADLSPAEEALITVLLKKALLTTEQVHVAQLYGKEHNRDLRQAILELNLISPELLNQLAFERLTALAADNGQAGTEVRAHRRRPPVARPDAAPPRCPQGAPGEVRHLDPLRAGQRRPACGHATARRRTSISTRRRTDCGSATGSTASSRTSSSSSPRWPRRWSAG